MRLSTFYLFLVILVMGSCQPKKQIEPNVFLMLSKAESENAGVSLGYSYFGKEFWNYFFKKYPVSTKLIFPDKEKGVWGISKFGLSTESNIDTSKYYFSRVIDLNLRQQLDSMLPKNVLENELGISKSNMNPAKVEMKISSDIKRDYSNFRHLLSDTIFNSLTLYCDKEVLNKIQSFQYAL